MNSLDKLKQEKEKLNNKLEFLNKRSDIQKVFNSSNMSDGELKIYNSNQSNSYIKDILEDESIDSEIRRKIEAREKLDDQTFLDILYKKEENIEKNYHKKVLFLNIYDMSQYIIWYDTYEQHLDNNLLTKIGLFMDSDKKLSEFLFEDLETLEEEIFQYYNMLWLKKLEKEENKSEVKEETKNEEKIVEKDKIEIKKTNDKPYVRQIIKLILDLYSCINRGNYNIEKTALNMKYFGHDSIFYDGGTLNYMLLNIQDAYFEEIIKLGHNNKKSEIGDIINNIKIYSEKHKRYLENNKDTEIDLENIYNKYATSNVFTSSYIQVPINKQAMKGMVS